MWGQSLTLVENCVASIIARSTYPDVEIIVVHDMIDESLLARLKALAGDRLVEVPFDRPFNFSEKINLGVARSSGRIVVPLNDDTMVASPGWLETLVAHLEEPDIGMVGPRLLLADGRIQSAGHCNKFGPHHVAAGCAADDTGPFGLLTHASEQRFDVRYSTRSADYQKCSRARSTTSTSPTNCSVPAIESCGLLKPTCSTSNRSLVTRPRNRSS